MAREASIYKFGLSVVCLFVCLYPINVKTAEPIGPKFFVGHHVIPGKVYRWLNFQKFASIKIRFLKILKIHEIFLCFCFTMYTKNMFKPKTILKDVYLHTYAILGFKGASRPSFISFVKIFIRNKINRGSPC